MGVGGIGDEQQREISIGFRRPRNLEGNIIYVQISPRDETYSAEAVSKIPFNSKYQSYFGYYITTRAIKARSREFGSDGKSFIEMLVQENHGVKNFTLVTDAYLLWDEIKQFPASPLPG